MFGVFREKGYSRRVSEQPHPLPTRAPEGSLCRQHDDRPALLSCPECGTTCCLSCWHNAISRCEKCLQDDPSAGYDDVPFEQASGLSLRGFWGTLRGAFSPVITATSMRGDGLRRPIYFFLLTFPLLALLQGVVPFTHDILFFPAFGTKVRPDVTSAELAFDIARACGLGLAFSGISLLALFVPFVSLASSFSSRGGKAALRLTLYRGWLVPLSLPNGLVVALLHWSGPARLPEFFSLLIIVASVVPLVLVFVAMRSTMRLSQGIAPLVSMGILLPPLILSSLSMAIFQSVTMPLMPPVYDTMRKYEEKGETAPLKEMWNPKRGSSSSGGVLSD